jgi:hypothetical protein
VLLICAVGCVWPPVRCDAWLYIVLWFFYLFLDIGSFFKKPEKCILQVYIYYNFESWIFYLLQQSFLQETLTYRSSSIEQEHNKSRPDTSPVERKQKPA